MIDFDRCSLTNKKQSRDGWTNWREGMRRPTTRQPRNGSKNSPMSATALDMLVDALDRCRDEDMGTARVFAALDFLQLRADQKWPFDQFRRALDTDNEEGRWQNLNASLNGIKFIAHN
jgi:hypothetical protein